MESTSTTSKLTSLAASVLAVTANISSLSSLSFKGQLRVYQYVRNLLAENKKIWLKRKQT